MDCEAARGYPSTVTDTATSTPLYTVPQAARLMRAPYRTIRRWVSKEYGFGREGELLSFQDLVELYLVAKLRRSNISFQRIRRVSKTLCEILDTNRPFSSGRIQLLTDGKTVVMESKEVGMLDLDIRQHLIKDVVRPFLRDVEFINDEAVRWWPDGRDSKVVVDPTMSFGAPVIEGTGVAVETITMMLKAGDEPQAIASMFDLDEESVLSAMGFIVKRAA